MTLGRRSFVTAALAGAASAGLHAGAAALPVTPALGDPVLLLVDATAPPGFVVGAGGALAASGIALVHRRADDEGRALAGGIAWLAAQPGRRVVALLRDADAVLLEQMARDGAVRCLSSAQHCQSAGAGVQSRHRITALSSNAGLAGVLAAELAAGGLGFVVVAEQPGEPRAVPPPHDVPPITAAAIGWDAALGRVLALIAAGHWPDRTPDAARIFTGGGMRAVGESHALRSYVLAI